MNHKFQGMSLIELLVVLLILSILMALAPPAFHRQVASARMDQAISGIASNLRHARSIAVLENRRIGVLFDLSGRTYEITDSERETVQRSIPESINVRVVTGRSEITGSSTGTIQFYPDGTSSGGEIRFVGERGSVTIEISWLTGRVRVHDAATA